MMVEPKRMHLVAAKHVLRYLQGVDYRLSLMPTPDCGLSLMPTTDVGNLVSDDDDV